MKFDFSIILSNGKRCWHKLLSWKPRPIKIARVRAILENDSSSAPSPSKRLVFRLFVKPIVSCLTLNSFSAELFPVMFDWVVLFDNIFSFFNVLVSFAFLEFTVPPTVPRRFSNSLVGQKTYPGPFVIEVPLVAFDANSTNSEWNCSSASFFSWVLQRNVAIERNNFVEDE